MHTDDGLEALTTKLERGWRFLSIDSTQERILVTLHRGSERGRITLDAEDARRILEDGLSPEAPVPA